MIPQYRLIKINDYWIIVSDEEIKEGNTNLVIAKKYLDFKIESYGEGFDNSECIKKYEILTIKRFITSNSISFEGKYAGANFFTGAFNKVIAQWRNKKPNIPLFDLPEKLEDDVEKMAEEYALDKYREIESSKLFKIGSAIFDFEAGYNKHAEKYLFTKEHVEKAIEMAKKKTHGDTSEFPEFIYDEDEILQSLQQPKEYIVEIEQNEDGSPKITDGKITIKNIL